VPFSRAVMAPEPVNQQHQPVHKPHVTGLIVVRRRRLLVRLSRLLV
jgi:hypothetical protein